MNLASGIQYFTFVEYRWVTETTNYLNKSGYVNPPQRKHDMKSHLPTSKVPSRHREGAHVQMTPKPTIPGTFDGTMRWIMTLLFSLPPIVVRVPASLARTTFTC